MRFLRRVAAVVVGLLIVGIALGIWNFWPSEGGQTADIVAEGLDARGCLDVTRDDLDREDLPPFIRDGSESAESAVTISCHPTGGSINLLRFESVDAAVDAVWGQPATSCTADEEVLLPGPGSTGLTRQACEQIGGTWRLKSEQFTIVRADGRGRR